MKLREIREELKDSRTGDAAKLGEDLADLKKANSRNRRACAMSVAPSRAPRRCFARSNRRRRRFEVERCRAV